MYPLSLMKLSLVGTNTLSCLRMLIILIDTEVSVLRTRKGLKCTVKIRVRYLMFELPNRYLSNGSKLKLTIPKKAVH